MSAEDEFCDACFREDIGAALRLIPTIDPTWRNPSSGGTLLHVGVEHGHVDVIRSLAAAGVELDATDKVGWTALCLAVEVDIDGAAQSETPCELTMTRLLLELGCDPRAGRGVTAIEIAEGYGNDEAVQLLTQC